MKRTIAVHLGERPEPIGVLLSNKDGARESAIFEYTLNWLEDVQRFPLDPSLPLIRGPQFHKAGREGSIFHPAIADTEPDGWAKVVILRDHAKRRAAAREVDAQLPPVQGSLEFLLAVDDQSRIGALRFRDEAGIFCRAREAGRRTTPAAIELRQLVESTRAVELNQETAADLVILRGRGTSLGGLRPKCTLIDHEGRLAIGKFPSVNDTGAVTKAEVLALRLAAAAGIDAAIASLTLSDETPVAVIRRFDRDAAGARIMYVSAATLLGVDRGAPEQHSYAEIVDAIRQHGADAQRDVEELYRRIAFSILITNVDDHLHNHGFLHVESGKWRLSPAFDLNPFPERERELKTWITEESGPSASIESLRSAAAYFGLRPARAAVVIGAVEAAVGRWRTVGGGLGMTSAELDHFEDAFEHSERAAARSVRTQL